MQTNTKIINIYTDGGARGNPGPSALGVYIEDDAGNEIKSIGKVLGVNTNNFAEYSAVVEGLNFIKENMSKFLGLERINFFMDSNLVMSQLNGLYKIKHAKMREFVFEIKALENELKIPITYSHIPREKNKKADSLVNQALDADQFLP